MMSTIDTISTKKDCGEETEWSSPSSETVAKIWRWLANAMVKRRTRIHLSELSQAQLRDIGVSPGEAHRESARFFWD
ncbi:MAG: DUF1127 domain-containing protein [Phyllobacterium sp.]